MHSLLPYIVLLNSTRWNEAGFRFTANERVQNDPCNYIKKVIMAESKAVFYYEL